MATAQASVNPDARERILSRVRAAVGVLSGAARGDAVAERLRIHPISPRPQVDGDLIACFRDKAQRLSTTISEVALMRDVPVAVAAYLHGNNLPMRAVCWKGLRMLDWANHGVLAEERPAMPSDLVGITEVFCAIAETGTLMTLSGLHTPPATSLLPETHIAVVRVSQIVPAMEEAWRRLRDADGVNGFMPRAVNFISGPSRTADIEQTLTFGAHGPYRVHVVLVAEDEVSI